MIIKKNKGENMGNFSDYIKRTDINNSDNINVDNDKKEDLEKLIEKYSSLSDNDLMKEFLKMTIERKKQGKLNEEELTILKSTILPYLDESQKNTLENLLEMIKNV